MPVTLNATTTSEATATGATQLDFTALTVAAGSNRVLLATVVWPSSVTSPALNWDQGGTPQALSLIGSVAYGSGSLQLWGVVSPTTGNRTLRAAWTGASDCMLHAQAYDGANLAGAFAHFVSATGDSAVPSIDIPSAVGNFTVAGAVSTNDPVTPTQTLNFENATITFSSSGSRAVGATTVTHAWSLSSTQWATVGVEIVAAAAATGGDEWMGGSVPLRRDDGRHVTY